MNVLERKTDRRAALSTGALATIGLLLPGCTSSRVRPAATQACLAPVRVGQEMVLRSVAGLRPFRPGGFVVRPQIAVGKTIVHNYGHGGAGITLSWGTSKLAVEIALREQPGTAAVIGAGVMGLTTARLAQEAGFRVSLYAADPPERTTSRLAGGQWSPFGHFDAGAVTPAWRSQMEFALDYSWRRFQSMVGPRFGVAWLPTYSQTRDADLGTLQNHRFHRGARVLRPVEHPFPAEHMVYYETMYVDTSRFLPQLLADFLEAGGRFELRRFAEMRDLTALPDQLVFNCTGIGAGALFGDEDLVSIRGQLVVLRAQPEIEYAYVGRAGYMFPRPGEIILGGTFERGNWSTVPDPDTTAAILAAHEDLFTRLRCGSGRRRTRSQQSSVEQQTSYSSG